MIYRRVSGLRKVFINGYMHSVRALDNSGKRQMRFCRLILEIVEAKVFSVVSRLCLF
jgi:hypothetical protein